MDDPDSSLCHFVASQNCCVLPEMQPASSIPFSPLADAAKPPIYVLGLVTQDTVLLVFCLALAAELHLGD